MYSPLQLTRKYLSYYFRASNNKGHGMHSPFVFDFIRHVLNNGKNYQSPREVEDIRKSLLKDDTLIPVKDLGAGSRTGASSQRKISAIARNALKSPRLAQMLFRLVKHYQPATILELGTSLGITTIYFSKANPKAQITTIEGSPAIAQKAKANFNMAGANNIRLAEGGFEAVLPQVLPDIEKIDLAYIDGNHRYEPTMEYFNQLLPKVHADSILVFDDIHWSADMERAWKEIQSHPAVVYTIDIFFLGFVFFRNEFKVKQDFTIRF